MTHEDGVGPSAGLSPLARARLDELLAQLLERVQEVMDTQDRLRGLLDAVVGIAADLSLDRVLERIVTVACKLSGARYGALGVLGAGPERRLREFVTSGLTEDERKKIGDLPRGHGILGLIIDNPEPLRLPRLGDHPLSYGFPANHPPMGTFLGVPIRTRGQVFGNLYLTEKQGGEAFTHEDEEIVVALAAAAGVVIENARLYEQTTRRERWLEAAAEITAALLGPVSRQEALQLVAERAREVAGADVTMVMLPALDEPRLVTEVVAGADPAFALGSTVPLAGTIPGTVVATGSMLVVDALMKDERHAAGGFVLPPHWPELGPVVALPLRTAAGVNGVLMMAWTAEREDAFRETDLRLPATFAEQAALALRVTQAQEDQSRLAVFEDRDRIGRDLHDLVIQRLFAIGLTLENASRLAVRPEVTQRITQAVDDIDATIKDIRRAIFELAAPAASKDLRAELRATIDVVVPALGFTPRLQTSGPVDSAVGDRVRPHLLAVLRESLANAARHANASTVEVRLEAIDEIVLTVRDNGKGLGERTRESGLRNMRDRAAALGGTLDLSSPRGGGTVLVWRVPISAGSDPPDDL
jgi:two-component system, NarL family, sensor histidine kinase DevS